MYTYFSFARSFDWHISLIIIGTNEISFFLMVSKAGGCDGSEVKWSGWMCWTMEKKKMKQFCGRDGDVVKEKIIRFSWK